MKIGFIGCGNMGGAILQGILQGGTPAADIYVADHNLETLRQRLGPTGVQICRSNTEVAALCDTVFLAVKPNVLSAVLAEIGPVLAERKALPPSDLHCGRQKHGLSGGSVGSPLPGSTRHAQY